LARRTAKTAGCIGETARRADTPPGPVAARPDERRRRQAIPVVPRFLPEKGHRAARATTRGVRTVHPDDLIAAPPYLATRPGTPLRRGVPGLSFVYRARHGPTVARHSFRATRDVASRG